jgi:nicotinate phosphoribosyltransferase
MNALLTDLYELTMAAGYYAAGKHHEIATFEFSVRRLPEHRDFILVAGLQQALEYLANLRFTSDEIAYLRGLPQFSNASPEFFEYLASFRFTGNVFAVPEGTPMFAGEPIMTIQAPIIEAQIPETYLLATITFQTLIATKASRVVAAAEGRDVYEFGARRAHTPDAGVLGARASYIGGCAGTSNTLAGFRFGIPVVGTAAHSWVMSFESEIEAFRNLQKFLGERTVQLIDTYDTIEGARRVISLGEPVLAVRLDSGDFIALSREVRTLLDQAGMQHVKIMLSGDLNEQRIAHVLAEGAPVDSFGVGTELATSADAPSMGAIYKIVELESNGVSRPTAKYSAEKTSLPGAKQVFRYDDRDIVACSGECACGAEALQKPVMVKGEIVCKQTLEQARARARKMLAAIDPIKHGVEYSHDLLELARQVREEAR